MNKRITAFLTALLMTSCLTVPVSAEDYFYDGTDGGIFPALEHPQYEYAADSTEYYVLTEDSAEYDAALPAKPTIAVKTAFGGKTITFSCADADAVIYYNFGSSNITASSRSAKPGETVFISEPMATGIYFKSYRNGQWSAVAKWGFNNVRIAQPIITQSGPASAHKYKLYTQTKDSYIIYTLDGSDPAIEEGTQSLKVKNGRIVWGTSAVVEVPAGRTIKAIAIRCGLVTSEVMSFMSPVPPADTSVPAMPKLSDYGFAKADTTGEQNAGIITLQSGTVTVYDAASAIAKTDEYMDALRAKGFTVERQGARDKEYDDRYELSDYYFIYYKGEYAATLLNFYVVYPQQEIITTVMIYKPEGGVMS